MIRIIKTNTFVPELKGKYPNFFLENTNLSPSNVKGFKDLIAKGASEREIDKYLRRTPYILSVILSYHNTGHHGMIAIPQQCIRPSTKGIHQGLIPDWIIGCENSDGISWWVLELKSPEKKIFSGKNNNLHFSSDANRGTSQLLKYLDFCTEHQAYLRNVLKLENFREPKGILMIGREDELIENKDKQRLKAHWNRINPYMYIRTYDSLIRNLDSK